MDLKDIHELVKEIREDQKEQSKTLTKLEICYSKMETVVSDNTEDIREHIRRTNVLEDLHKDNEKRLYKLEQPISVKEFIKRITIYTAWVGGISTAIYELLKILNIKK